MSEAPHDGTVIIVLWNAVLGISEPAAYDQKDGWRYLTALANGEMEIGNTVEIEHAYGWIPMPVQPKNGRHDWVEDQRAPADPAPPWLPVTQAPRDGTVIMLLSCAVSGIVVPISYVQEDNAWHLCDEQSGGGLGIEPVIFHPEEHYGWLPLPVQPKWATCRPSRAAFH
jgi:hypothetical protein